MLTSKQRAYLRSLATNADTIVFVGKDGLSDNVVAEVKNALKARELVKGKVLESSMLSAREALVKLAEDCKAEQVQFIGNKFVLYKRNETEPKIELPKKAKK